MDDDAKEVIQDQIRSLAKPLQDAITQSGWEERCREIARDYGLSDEQAAMYETECTMALIGITDVRELEANLVNGHHHEPPIAHEQIGTCHRHRQPNILDID